MPELDLCAYALKPVRKGQTVGTLPEDKDKSVRKLKRKDEEKIFKELALSGQALKGRVLDLGS